MRKRSSHYKEAVEGMLLSMMVELIRLSEVTSELSDKRKKVSSTQISAALDHIRVAYAKPIRIEELANICQMSETHFRRVFEASMNMSPMDYINLTRIQIACELMKSGSDSMDVVANKVGFATTSTFNRNFKKFLNTSPYQWKISPENYE